MNRVHRLRLSRRLKPTLPSCRCHLPLSTHERKRPMMLGLSVYLLGAAQFIPHSCAPARLDADRTRIAHRAQGPEESRVIGRRALSRRAPIRIRDMGVPESVARGQHPIVGLALDGEMI